MFPDVEKVLVELLAQFVTSPERVGTYTPADLEKQLPFIRVTRYGGGDDGITDQPAVDVDCFAATRSAAIDLARTVHQYLISGRHRAGPALIDLVRTDVGPIQRPWNDGAVRRFGASYVVGARRVLA